MRICYVAHADAHFTPPYIDYFAARGHEVHLISCHPQDLPNAVNHHPAGASFDPHRANLAYFWLQFAVRRLIRRIQPDLVHAHYVTSNGFMAAASGFHPLVVSARGSDVHQSASHPLKRRLLGFTLRRADLVNPVSRELEGKLRDLGVPAEKMLRLTQGIEAERFATGPRPPRNVLRFVCTRKLFPIYQSGMILEALAELAREGRTFKFTFAGTGPEEAALRARCHELGLSEQVSFLGGFTQAALPALLAQSDIYVSASRWDGTSPALLEGMAAGLLPVVSDIPANREWLGPADALLFPPDDGRSLVDGLRRALTEPDRRARAAADLPRKVREEADRSTNLARLEERYEQLVAARPRKGQSVPAATAASRTPG